MNYLEYKHTPVFNPELSKLIKQRAENAILYGNMNGRDEITQDGIRVLELLKTEPWSVLGSSAYHTCLNLWSR